MSLQHVRPYFRNRAVEIWGSEKEWKEPFNVNNIPSTIIDGSFNVELLTGSGVKQNQTDLEIQFPVKVRYFKKGYRDPQAGLDLATAAADSYIRQALKHSTRLVGEGIKNVQLTAFDFVRLNESNDNLIMVEMDFTALVILEVD